MAAWLHCFPTREYVIAAVRASGARTVYGPDWRLSEAATIARLTRLSDRDYAIAAGCDHCDAHGNCLGHDDEDAA